MSALEKPQDDVQVEERSNESKDGSSDKALEQTVRLDKYGLPLVPQPSSDKMDPLNFKTWVKIMVLGEVSLLSFLALLSASLITPTFVPLSKYLHQSLVQTAYVTSLFVLFVGLAPIFWNPISNVYGRRPVYIISTALAMVTSVASGKSTTYGMLLAFRSLNGFFGGVSLGLGNATVCDMFFVHERGFYMGIYTVSFITGGHIAPIIGGYIEESLTWRWCFYIPAILTGATLVLFILTVPETLYSRAPEALARPSRSLTKNLMMVGKIHPTRKLKLVDFVRPFQMLKYPSVYLPAFYYAMIFAYGSVLFIITSANLFGAVYHFQPQQTGLLLGVPITVGSVIGESVSGGFSDWIAEKRALARNGERKPEDRLLAMIPAFVLVPLGVIIEGVCLQHKTRWIGVAMGIAIASVGLQIATTPIYAYTADCYKPQSAELGTIISLIRQIYSFAMGFYAIPLAEEIGTQNAWIVFGMITFAFSLPIIALIFKGEEWRKRLGQPNFHKDL